MKVVFRADASIQIGTGHVMRCLTLANVLHEQGAVCTFICREHAGHLIDHIRTQGHAVHVLALSDIDEQGRQPFSSLAHSAWLDATQEQDIEACSPILEHLQPDWLVVDHYALDAHWERALKDYCRHVLVIDDLADRPHECDVLLDQNLGSKVEDYQGLIPTKCMVLIGPEYALLRPEFAALREYSLARRQRPQLKHLLITMGGVDAPNGTGQVLDALRLSCLSVGCRITVVMGSAAPHLAAVRAQAASLPWATDVCVDVRDMAHLMAESDLCIGAAGGTSWERCCLGLPTIMVVLADNQQANALALVDAGAAILVTQTGNGTDLPDALAAVIEVSGAIRRMSDAACRVTSGVGRVHVTDVLMGRERAQ